MTASLLGIISLSLLDPLRALLRMPIHRLLVLQQLPHPVRVRHMSALLHPGPRQHPIRPGLQGRELCRLDTRPRTGLHPAPMRDIRDCALVANEIVRLGILEMLLQHRVQAARLVLISVDAVLDLLRRVSEEMVGLSLHRAHAAVQEEKPVVDFIALAGTLGVGDLVLRVVLLDEVLQDGTGLEEADLLAVGEGVSHGWDAAVRVDLEEPGLLLGVFGSVDLVHFVLETIFCQRGPS